MSTQRARVEYIRNSVEAYQGGRIPLRQLVNDLESIVNSLQPGTLRDQLHQQWWTLEQVYSVALDRGDLEDLPPESAALVDEAVMAIASLAQQ